MLLDCSVLCEIVDNTNARGCTQACSYRRPALCLCSDDAEVTECKMERRAMSNPCTNYIVLRRSLQRWLLLGRVYNTALMFSERSSTVSRKETELTSQTCARSHVLG